MRKQNGFTLTELLAVIVVLGVILTITITSVLSINNSSKEKAEEVFVSTIRDSIKTFILNNKTNFGYIENVGEIEKGEEKKELYEIKKDSINCYTYQDVVDSGLISENELINPNTKQECTNLENVIIRIYRDEDYIYYFETDGFEGLELNCINDEIDNYKYNNP